MEMANWVITWINGGKFKGKEILPASYTTEAMSSQMVVGAGIPSKEKPDIQFANYGFGWFLGSYKSHYRVDHGGNIDGFSASTCFFPSDSVGIVVLTNQNGSAVTSVVRNLLADRMLKLPYFDWNTDLKRTSDKGKATAKEAEKTRTSSRKTNTAPSHALKEYEGMYNHAGYGSFDISVIHDSLFARLGKEQLWLRHYHYDIFEPFNNDPKDGIDTADKSQLRFQFQMNEAGDINTVNLALEPTLPPLKFNKTPKPKAITKEELQKFVGEYEFNGVAAKVYIKDDKTLYILIPGQPDYELIPIDKNKFSLKLLSGFYIQFEVNDTGQTTDLTFMQPNGNFKAKKK